MGHRLESKHVKQRGHKQSCSFQAYQSGSGGHSSTHGLVLLELEEGV